MSKIYLSGNSIKREMRTRGFDPEQCRQGVSPASGAWVWMSLRLTAAQVLDQALQALVEIQSERAEPGQYTVQVVAVGSTRFGPRFAEARFVVPDPTQQTRKLREQVVAETVERFLAELGEKIPDGGDAVLGEAEAVAGLDELISCLEARRNLLANRLERRVGL